jgi:hypothetical protein
MVKTHLGDENFHEVANKRVSKHYRLTIDSKRGMVIDILLLPSLFP